MLCIYTERLNILVPFGFQRFLSLEGMGIVLDKGGQKVSVLTAAFACVPPAQGQGRRSFSACRASSHSGDQSISTAR